MSKTVDQRVVEMQFDNKNFEKNVSTTMSTLDKFKQKLHLDGASKGLDTVGSSVDTLKMKFSALDVVGVTALTNITNSVVNAGKRVLDSFTLEPIRTGFNEYELKMGSIQTIMASTGESLDVVNQYLDELNKYSDDTIYSFKDMTSNIGKFTNAGVNLKDAVSAIKGVSNEAAISGANAEEASRAMYNFAQALSAGYVKLIDWKSIENANMATVSFKDELMKTALELGTVVQEGGKYISTTTDMAGKTSDAFDATHNFNDSLSAQWMTTDVLTKTLSRYADETTDIGKKATEAATKIKTFSMMMDTLKEAAQSGWAKTWELIFGDFDQATALWTKLGTFFGDIIGKIDNARNSLIKGVLGQSSKWDDFEKKVNDAGVSTEDFSKKLEGVAKEHGIAIDDMIAEQGSLIDVIKSGKIPREVFVDTLKEFANAEAGTSEATEDMTDKLEYFQNVVNDVWRGDFKNGEERIQALTDAGYEYSKVQDLVNKTVDGHKLTLEELSDVQLESVGYTEEQISALRQLAEEAEQSGSSIDKMLEQMNRPSGRELIFGEKNGILSNQLYNLKAAIDSIGKAFSSVFKKDGAVEGVYGFLKKLQEITYKLRMSDETAQNLEKTFKGVFTVFKLLSSVLIAGIMIPFKILNGVLGSFNSHILDVTGGVGELVYQFGQWIQKCGLLNKGINFAVSGIVKLINWIGKGYNKLTSIPIVSNNLNNLKSTIKDLFENSDKYFNAGKDTVLGWINAFNKLPVISGAVSGVKGAFNDLIQLIKDIVDSSKNWTSFGDALKDISDRIFPKFQSASRATAKSGRIVAENISLAANKTEPAASKLSGAVSGVYETMKKFVDFVGNKLANLNLGKILATAFGATFVVAAVKTFTLVSSFSKLLDGVTGLLGSATGVVNNFGKALGNISKASKNVAKSMKFKAIGEMVWDMAKSFVLIAGALVVLSKVDGAGLRNALVALGLVIGAMVGLTVIMSKFPVKDTTLSVGIIMALSVAVVILAKAVKTLSGIDFLSAIGAIGAVTILLTELVAACIILGKFGGTMTKGSGMLLTLSISMVIMSLAVSNLAKLDPEAATNAVLLLSQLMLKMGETLFIIGLVGKSAKSGATGILLLTLSMGLMALLVKVVSKFTVKEVVTAGIIMTAMIAMIYVMSKCMKQLGNAGQYATKAGRAIFLISAAMLLMAASVKIFSSMSLADIAKGSIAILGFTLMCGLLIQFVRKTGNNAGKAAAVILAFGVAMTALSVSLFILSSLNPAGIAIGTAAISAITLMMSLLVKSTRYATDVSKSIVAIAICIGVIAGSIALLSMLNPAKAALGTGAIAVILGMVTVLVKSTTGVHPDMYKNLLAITGIIAAIGLIIGILATLPIDKTIGIVASLSMMLVSIAASMKIISSVRVITKDALIGLAAMTLVMAALGVILALVAHFTDTDKALPIAASLSLLILSLSASCILLAIAGTAGPAALVGVAALVELMTGLSVLIGAIVVVMTVVGALVTKFPMLETFLDTGLSLLGKIGKGIGEFFGNIVAGFDDGAPTGLIAFADNLSGFMKHLQPFLDSANGIDPSVVNSVKSLAEAILILTAANLLDSIGSFIGLDADWSKLGNKLVSFGQAITDFSNKLNDGNISAEKVESAANAGKMIAELQDALPRTGGWWGSIAGEKDLEKFGNQMVAFGTAIINFSNELDKGNINAEKVEAAANAGKLIAELENALPRTGGWWESVAGKKDLGTFGTKVEAFGESIAKFAGSISGGIEQSDIDSAANAGKLMAELENALPKSDGWWQSVAGEKDISTFGTKIESFGESLRLFGQKVNNIGYTNVNRAIESSNNLISLMKDASSINADAVGGFTGGLAALGRTSVDGFISAFSERDGEAISEATSFVNKVAEGIQNGRPNTRAAMDDVLKELITIIGEWNTDFKSAADSITSGLKAGIEDGRQNTRSAIDDVLSEIITICGEWQTDMYNAGSYLVQGFANGIREDSWRAEAASKAMANQAYVAAQKELDEHSPSKKFKKVGAYVASGFAIGIASLGSKIKQSTRSMSQNAIDVMSESMSSVNHLLNSDMNVQPTIRPVLDLSSVQSEASNIGNLLNGNYRVGAMASSIATSQNSRVTVTNSDVVGAINRLRKDINEMPQGNTYRIDGITYDDGSNISSAVETLVRAATVGRRV